MAVGEAWFDLGHPTLKRVGDLRRQLSRAVWTLAALPASASSCVPFAVGGLQPGWETVRVSSSAAGPARRTVLKVSLLGSDPLVWRQLSVRGDMGLDEVHRVLQAAMGWEDAHLHRFTTKDPYLRLRKKDLEQGWPPQWVPAESVEEEFERPEEHAALAELLEAGRGSAFYEYDFGDSWLHRIEAVGEEPADALPARLLAGAGACPPEDCGGIHSYLEFLHALADPADPGHADAVRCARAIDDDFDPSRFDATAAEVDVAKAQARSVKG